MHLLLPLFTNKAKLEEEWQEVNGEGLGMRRIHERNSDEEVREQCNSSHSGSRLLSPPPLKECKSCFRQKLCGASCEWLLTWSESIAGTREKVQ